MKVKIRITSDGDLYFIQDSGQNIEVELLWEWEGSFPDTYLKAVGSNMETCITTDAR